MVQAMMNTPAAGTAWPFVGIVRVTVGGPFGGRPGSRPIVKSDGWFVSVHVESRSKIRPGPGAGPSPRIVFPGSQSSVPPRVALNSTRSATRYVPAADAVDH